MSENTHLARGLLREVLKEAGVLHHPETSLVDLANLVSSLLRRFLGGGRCNHGEHVVCAHCRPELYHCFNCRRKLEGIQHHVGAGQIACDSCFRASNPTVPSASRAEIQRKLLTGEIRPGGRPVDHGLAQRAREFMAMNQDQSEYIWGTSALELEGTIEKQRAYNQGVSAAVDRLPVSHPHRVDNHLMDGLRYTLGGYRSTVNAELVRETLQLLAETERGPIDVGKLLGKLVNCQGCGKVQADAYCKDCSAIDREKFCRGWYEGRLPELGHTNPNPIRTRTEREAEVEKQVAAGCAEANAYAQTVGGAVGEPEFAPTACPHGVVGEGVCVRCAEAAERNVATLAGGFQAVEIPTCPRCHGPATHVPGGIHCRG